MNTREQLQQAFEELRDGTFAKTRRKQELKRGTEAVRGDGE